MLRVDPTLRSLSTQTHTSHIVSHIHTHSIFLQLQLKGIGADTHTHILLDHRICHCVVPVENLFCPLDYIFPAAVQFDLVARKRSRMSVTVTLLLTRVQI